MSRFVVVKDLSYLQKWKASYSLWHAPNLLTANLVVSKYSFSDVKPIEMNESWNRFFKWFVVKPSGSLASVRCSIAQWSGVMFPNSDNCVQRAILVQDNLFFVPRSESFWYPSEQEGRNHQKKANKQSRNKTFFRLVRLRCILPQRVPRHSPASKNHPRPSGPFTMLQPWEISKYPPAVITAIEGQRSWYIDWSPHRDRSF